MANETEKQAAKTPNDLGFGTQMSNRNVRFINPDGSFNVRRLGLSFSESFHFYHYLITLSWSKFFSVITLFFLLANCCFTALYMLIGVEHIGGMIAHNAWQKFYETFFFSTQTLTTVGYGRINPTGFFTSAVAAVESMLGLMGFALITGVLYGRFARPNSKILFSKNIIVSPYKQVNAIMFRMANLRKSQLIETEVQLVVGYNKMVNGAPQRAFITLELERSKINFFPLSWTVVHPIDDSSALKDVSMKELADGNAEFSVLVKAFDDTFHQHVYARYSYLMNDMVEGVKFVPTYSQASDGIIEMDFEKFDHYASIQLN